jgi:hypothetical protein
VILVVSALSLGLFPAAHAQRRGTETVVRAPAMVIQEPTVTGSLTVNCMVTAVGPEQMQVTEQRGQALGGLVTVSSSTTQYQEVYREECGALVSGYESALRSAVEGALRSVGRTVTWQQGGGSLDITVNLSPTATMRHVSDRTDGEGDDTCRNVCNADQCKVYSVGLSLGESVTVAAPSYDGQSQGFSGNFPNDYLAFEFIDCSNDAAARRHREFASSGSWSQLFGRVNGEISGYLNPQLGMSTDEFSMRVANVRRSRSARPAFESFEAGMYADAAGMFLSALETDGADLNTSNQADLLFNAALAALLAGDFVIAEEHAQAAFRLDRGDRVTRLLEEITRRTRDAGIFQTLGLPDQF